ncbi:MAG TPA: hypothetical protein VJ486_10330 [Geothrix sp.]|nr:hypothetical protein [Geothrix sp.]
MLFRTLAALFLSLCFLACGGGGSSSSNNPPPPPQNPAGLWTGTISSNAVGTLTAIAASNSQGVFRYYGSDDSQGVGQLSISGSSFTGTGTIYNSDGTTTALSLSSGVLTANTSFTAQWSGGGYSGAMTFTHDSNHDRPVSISSLEGTYHAASDKTSSGYTADVTISGSGTFLGSSGGGNFTGSVSQIDPTMNLFSVSLQYTGETTVYTGFGFWSDGQSANLDANSFYVQLSGGGSALAAVLAKQNPAATGSVTIINQSGQAISEVYITLTTDTTWGSNWLSSSIPNGSSRVIPNFAPGAYDCMVVVADGKSGTLMNFQITAGQTYTITVPVL